MCSTSIYLVTTLLVVGGFTNGGPVHASKNHVQCKSMMEHLPVYARTYTNGIVPISSFEEKPDEESRGKEYDEVQEELKRLMEEMKRLGKEGKERLRKDILPRIREEIEKLRKKLKKYHLDDEEKGPIET